MQSPSSLRCVACGEQPARSIEYRCPACGDVLEVDFEPTCGQWDALGPDDSLWRYGRRLGMGEAEPVTLGEGMTPLLEASPALAGERFQGTLLLKDETRNPTGSFKDRLISVAATRAIEEGYRAIVCASTGNAGASAAAYAARAGIDCVICVPQSTTRAKLAQIDAYGPTLLAVKGTYSASWAVADALTRSGSFANVTTTYQNPHGVAALRTVAYELLDAMSGQVPDAVFVPTGSGPLVRGVQWGYAQALALGLIESVPAVVAVQAAGCAPIVRAYDAQDEVVRPWEECETAAAGIADPLVGYAQDGTHTLASVRASGGWAVAVSDDEIRSAAVDLGTGVGVLAEMAGAAGLAGLRASMRQGRLSPDATAVVLVTGSGLKDLDLHQPGESRRVEIDPAGDDIDRIVERIAASRLRREEG